MITRKIYRKYTRNRNNAAEHPAIHLLVFVLLFLLSVIARADGYVLSSVGGSLTYGYGYGKSSQVESENNALGLMLSTNAYIWQPWFLTHTLSAGLSYATSTVKGQGKTRGQTLTGGTDLSLFPVSRFPTYLSYNISDSYSDSFQQTNFDGRRFVNSRLLFRQSYVGESNFFSALNYVKVNSKGEGLDAETQNVDLRARGRIPKHDLDASFTYLTSDSVGATSKPQQSSLNLTHSYLPGPAVAVNTSANSYYSTNQGFGPVSDHESLGSQLSSYFSWRPEYKPVSISGGARVASTDSLTHPKDGSDDTTSYAKSYGANVGASFMLSTRARVNALASASSGDDDGTTHAENSVSGSYTYNSEQYLMVGFNYGFGFTASANRLSQQTDGQFTSENTVETNSGFGISHRANRTWLVGRASSLNLGLAQGLSAQLSGKSKGSGSITHSVSSGLSTHTLRGTTFISVAASDSRSTVFQSLSESEQTNQPPRSQFQNISLNLSRTHYINRYSNMGGEMAYTSNRVNSNASGTYQSEINTGSQVALHYQHSRLFSIYGMSLQSDLRYANTEGKEGRIAENTALSNKIYYSIGKLVTTLDLRADRNAGGNPQYTLNFRATRSF